MLLSDFDYSLPEEHIAQEPLFERDSSRLMFLDRSKKNISHHIFSDLPSLLVPGDVLVFNNSKVLPARIIFRMKDRDCEIFYLRDVSHVSAEFSGPGFSDPPFSAGNQNSLAWEVLVMPGKNFGVGDCGSFGENIFFRVHRITEKGTRIIVFDFPKNSSIPQSAKLDTFSLLEHFGTTPLPPYIHSLCSPDRYQTIYAEHPGSVAAPTAGFHFTDGLFRNLNSRGISREFITLHVGGGTFLPVKSPVVEKHTMHSEFFSLSSDTAARLQHAKNEGRRIIAVGTTSARVLETCTDENGRISARSGETDIFIFPGYRWKFVDGLITNFHLPKSTLLLLISAFAGKDFVFSAYEKAIAMRYRFYSFGDAMLLL